MAEQTEHADWQKEHADWQKELLQEPEGCHVSSSGIPSQCDQECHTSNMSQIASDKQEIEQTPY